VPPAGEHGFRREDAESRGVLKPGGTLVEATGGNSRAEMAGKTAVVILPDTGDRYLTSGLMSAG
jgi:cysteine synthase